MSAHSRSGLRSRISAMLRDLAVVAIMIGIANFAAFAFESSLLHGDALAGYQADGHFFVGGKHGYHEVSELLWTLNRIHGLSVLITHPLAIGSAWVLVLSVRFGLLRDKGSDPAIDRRRAHVLASGAVIACDRVPATIGLLRDYWSVVAVYPAGICISFRYGTTVTILASEIRRVWFERIYLRRHLSVSYKSGGQIDVLELRVAEDHPLAVAIRQIAADPPSEPVVVPPRREPGRAVLPVAAAGRDEFVDRSARFRPALEPGEGLLALPGWALADGVGELTVGAPIEFAVRVVDRGLRRAKAGSRAFTSRGGAVCEVRAEALYAADDLTILDFGLVCFMRGRPGRVSVGETVVGEIELEIDRIEFAELHARRAAVAGDHVIRRWLITGIWRRDVTDRAPLDVRASARARDTADPARFGYVAVERTGVAPADGSNGCDYLVRARPY